ncbi:MAG: DUF3267 domain-containing protein [Bacteroidales bacterium]|nr:MAG: DUF3267 domain-containing protein [Bacteroidales bacterium]
MTRQQDYTGEITLSVAKTYLYSLYLLIPLIIFLCIPYFVIWGADLINYWSVTIARYKSNFILSGFLYGIFRYLFWIIMILISGILMHELLHGFIWVFFTKKGFRSLSFGIMKPDLAPYIHCSEPLPVNAYRTGIIMPGIILGIFPSIIGIITGNFKIFIFGFFFTWAASGDFIMLWLIRHLKSPVMVQDHPELVGCLILKEDKSGEKTKQKK